MTDEELDALVKYANDHAAFRGSLGETMIPNMLVSLTATIADLRAQLAEARAERDVWEIDAKRNHQAAEIEFARAEQAEAALAAQIEVDARMLQSVADNWDCGCIAPYCRCAEAAEQWGFAADEIRNQPHDRTALDRYREKVLREAADAATASFNGFPNRCTDAILALIEVKP